MRIPDDGLLEVNEKFRIVLEEPVNAILGEKDRVTVRIINAESGKCLYFVFFLKRKQRIIIYVALVRFMANNSFLCTQYTSYYA